MRLNGFRRDLFPPGQRVCCALSGGADSTALLLALLEANAEKLALGVVLSAVHVHHGLRGAESDADAAFVRELCSHHAIPLTLRHVDTPARQAAAREGLEEAARELRHAVFATLLAENAADVVATAHTLDDQAETVMMKLLRGAWTGGLAGIAATRDTAEPGDSPLRLVRPMLAVRRAEVERFLGERAQSWRDDSSNTDLSLTRNRVRHQLMPMLRSFNPAADEVLARVAERAQEEEAYWQAEVARVLPGLTLPGRAVRGGGRAVSTAAGERSVALDLDRLKTQPASLQRRLLRAAAATLGCQPGAEDTAKLLALAGLGDLPGITARNGSHLDLGGGLRAERSIRELRLSRILPSDIPKKM